MSQTRQMETGKAQAWLQLLRPPNLPTIPGDPLAGLLLAGGSWRTDGAWVVAAALSIYAAGLLLNDYADRGIDLRERPRRPLPSGVVRPGAVLGAGLALGLAGVAAAARTGPVTAGVAGLLLGLVLTYDLLLPRGSAAGMVVMGACRSGSVALGIAAAGGGTTAAWSAAGGIGVYIAAVTRLARDEAETGLPRPGRWTRRAPLVAAAAMLGLVTATAHGMELRGGPLVAAAIVAALGLILCGGSRAADGNIGHAVGEHIRALLPMQAACCALAPDGWAVALLLGLLWPASGWLGRRFYAS